MKRILLIVLVFVTSFSYAQIVDVFNYAGALNANGWTTHSGTGVLNAIATPGDVGNSLFHTGLPSSTGNRATLIAGNGEDVNKALTGITGTGYFSFLLKVASTTGINPAGDYFMGFGGTSGATVSNLAARTFIKPGTTAGTFQLGIQNTTGGTPTQSYSGEYPVGTTVFVVVKYDITGSPQQASLFVNPTPGAVEPAATAVNNSGTAVTFTTFASLFIRQNGNAGSGTGNLEIDEIRAGGDWASVTPSGCGTSSTLNITSCGPYTLNAQNYTTSGTYSQILANANSAGCDSTIILNLTVNSPTTSTLTVTNCGPYTLNSQTYNASGTYTQTLVNGNAAGCDSTITLNLSVVASITYYADTDGDGLGDPNVSQTGCSQPQDYVMNGDDCNDNNNTIGLGTAWYADVDGDGYGNAAVSVVACTAPADHVANDDDCNDNTNTIGVAQTWYADTDGDGYGNPAVSVVACTAPASHVLDNTDCNDANVLAHPGGTEIPDNGIDDDCVGGDLNTLGAQLGQYTFTGNDCSTASIFVSVDAQPANAVFGDYGTAGTDCTMGSGYFNRSNWNMTSTIDLAEYNEFTVKPDNCYELELTKLKFLHRFSNSAGTPFVHIRSSIDNFATDIYAVQITTLGTNLTDSVMLSPDFASITDSVTFRFYVVGIASAGATYRNDNVSVYGFINALTPQNWYADADGDGFGDPAASVSTCVQPADYVSDNTDCNDNNPAEHPGAVWFQDLDNDNFGNPAVSLTQCTQPAGYITNNTDCNDNNNTVLGSVIYFADTDNDGFGDASNTTAACTPPAGYVTNDDDCDDTDNTIGLPTNQYFQDLDNDGFGSNTVVTACTQPVGYVSNNWDCDDNDNTVGMATTEYFADTDSDGFGDASSSIIACEQLIGFVLDSTDCNDNNASIYPGATDVFGNTTDENCDGIDGSVGLEELGNAALMVFPNPGSSEVNITLSGSWNTGISVTILSIDGKAVQTSTPDVSNHTVSVVTATLLPSVYFIRVTDGTHQATVRWVKQ
jgi:hypothetical protein